jgi:hypothetical protein
LEVSRFFLRIQINSRISNPHWLNFAEQVTSNLGGCLLLLAKQSVHQASRETSPCTRNENSFSRCARSTQSRLHQIWNGIDVHYFEKYPGPVRAYADMSSDLNTLAVSLEQKGGHCEARLDLNTATERNRYDAGFAVWVPSNRTVWGFSERARLVRDVRLTFDSARLRDILSDDLDERRLQTPVPIRYRRC